MNQDYSYAENVLQDLGYTTDEASKIIDDIKQGKYAFHSKKEKSVDESKQNIWMNDMCTGIDIPVLWYTNHDISPKTVILLAQDPLRDNDYWDYTTENLERNSHVIIGTPYALHLSETTKRAPVGTKKKAKHYNVGVYRHIIETLCMEGYNVYCTDIFKYYMQQKPCKEVTKFDIDIFINEYKLLKPIAIIGMGKKAHQAIKQLEILDEIKTILVKHPRSRPQRTTDTIKKEIIDLLSHKLQ